MKAKHLWQGLVLAVAILLPGGCESVSHRDGKMNEISGKYTLSQVSLNGKEYKASDFALAAQTAEIYLEDGQWFFDVIFPCINYHGQVEYHKAILPICWDQFLCLYYFEPYPDEEDRLGVERAEFKGEGIQIFLKSGEYYWERSNRVGE
jgi:hypothetical protein